MASCGRPVELTRAPDHPECRGELAGELPGVPGGSRNPQIEPTVGKCHRYPGGGQQLRCLLEAPEVATALHLDVVLGAECSDTGSLNRSRHHEPRVLAHLGEILHQVAVTGVEAEPQSGQVGALGQRVHRDHAVDTVFEDGPSGRHRLHRRFTAPGELGVALIGEHRNTVLPAPTRGRTEIVERASGVSGCVDPQTERPSGVARVDRTQIDTPVLIHGDGNGAAPRQRCAHGIGRVADSRVQHGVELRRAQPQPVRQTRDQLLGSDACSNTGGGHTDPEAVGEPLHRRLTQLRGADRRGVATLGVRRRQGLESHRRRRILRRADREVDRSPVEPTGDLVQFAQAVIGVCRRDESRTHVVPSATLNSAKRLSASSVSRAVIRTPLSPDSSVSTSPPR